MAPSRHYERALDLSKRHHQRFKTFSGRFLFRYAPDIKSIIDELGCKTMLDYGCGKGLQYVRPMENGEMLADYFGVAITKYDPAWPAFATEPKGKFDLVICTQVLGSIPIVDLPWVVDRLYNFATKAVYVGERLGPVRKRTHLEMVELMPRDWTRDQWASVLPRPKSEVSLYLRTKDVRHQDAKRHILGRIQ